MKLCNQLLLKSVLISLSSFMLLLNSQQLHALEISNNIGTGFGIPYGLFGANYELELNITDTFAIVPTVGLGTTLLAGAATVAGIRLYFGNKNSLLRFGLAYLSGTNTIVENGFDNYISEDGNTAGFSLRFQFGRSRSNGLDVGLMTILDPTEDEIRRRYFVEKEGGDVKISVGYVHRFFN